MTTWRGRVAALTLLVPLGLALAQSALPVAPVRDQVDTWHGVQVHDPYRYMENLADPEVRNWMLAQGSYARWLFDPIEVELVADGELVPLERARLIVSATIPDVGLGMRVSWQAGRVPGKFHFVASGISTTSMALQLAKVLTGKPLVGAKHVDKLVESVDFKFRSPQSWTLDGDLFRGHHVALRIGPRIRIVNP